MLTGSEECIVRVRVVSAMFFKIVVSDNIENFKNFHKYVILQK